MGKMIVIGVHRKKVKNLISNQIVKMQCSPPMLYCLTFVEQVPNFPNGIHFN